MAEAVLNHRPDVVIIDEIATVAEATAVVNIQQQHIQVITSARDHQTLLDVVSNPTFNQISGGIHDIFVSYHDIMKYKLRSNVAIQRSYAPVFHTLIEMRKRNKWIIYKDFGKAIDDMLLGENPKAEERKVVTFVSHDGVTSQQVIAMEIHVPVDYKYKMASNT